MPLVGRLFKHDSIDVAVARIGNGAAPFTAANRLAFSQNAAVSYIAAVGFTADSMISLTASEFNSTAIFKLLLQNTLVPELATGSATPSFTRATTASVSDFEGKVNTALSGESRFKGARRVENLIAGSSEDFGNAAWKVGGGASKVGAVTVEGIDAWEISFSANADELFQSSQAVYNDKTLVESVWLRAKTGTVDVSLDMDASGNTLTLDTTWRRYSTLETVTGGTQPSVVAKESGSIYIAKFQIEDVTGQSNQNPSEYVSVAVLSAPYHGANVDSVQYFNTLNGNTASSNVVTEATGALIGASNSYADANGPFGYMAEAASTNI